MTSKQTSCAATSAALQKRLSAYVAATGALGAIAGSRAEAAVIANTTIQPVGINGAASIDFNSDGQIDYQIDHDRVDLGNGSVVDYLQLDKNDVNGAGLGESPFAINGDATFALNGTVGNDPHEAGWVAIDGTDTNYPAALTAGTPIGPSSTFLTFQETDGYAGTKTIRANRLIDEDAGQVDAVLGGLSAAQLQMPTNGPSFVGLGGEIRYLGVKMDLNNTDQINYGWVGIEVTSDADATANVVGYGYETTPGVPIAAGAVPEPSTLVALTVGAAILFCRLAGRFHCNR
jgi:hypothetical protein